MNTLQYFAVRPPRSVHWRVPAYATPEHDLQNGRLMNASPRTSKASAAQRGHALATHARHRLDEHTHFRGRTRTINIDGMGDRLIITGQLPSFYLKQLLQEALMQVDGVGDIENRVDVVNSEGLSSSPAEAVASK